MQGLSKAYQGIQGLVNLFQNFRFFRFFFFLKFPIPFKSQIFTVPPRAGCHPLRRSGPEASFLPVRILEGDERMIIEATVGEFV